MNTYSYVTFSKEGQYFRIVFERDTEEEHYLVVKFLPKHPFMIFNEEHIDLSGMKLRDPEVILNILESYGITLILKGHP